MSADKTLVICRKLHRCKGNPGIHRADSGARSVPQPFQVGGALDDMVPACKVKGLLLFNTTIIKGRTAKLPIVSSPSLRFLQVSEDL